MKIITTYLTIGKSKEVKRYCFREDHFIRIEENELIIKDEARTLKISPEEVRSVIDQVNDNTPGALITKDHDILSISAYSPNVQERIKERIAEGWEVVNVQPHYEYDECKSSYILFRRAKV